VHVLLTFINASISKRSYLVLCLPSTARTEERAEGGDMRFSQKHLVFLFYLIHNVLCICDSLFIDKRCSIPTLVPACKFVYGVIRIT